MLNGSLDAAENEMSFFDAGLLRRSTSMETEFLQTGTQPSLALGPGQPSLGSQLVTQGADPFPSMETLQKVLLFPMNSSYLFFWICFYCGPDILA
jgi:hypothetical protein